MLISDLYQAHYQMMHAMLLFVKEKGYLLIRSSLLKLHGHPRRDDYHEGESARMHQVH